MEKQNKNTKHVALFSYKKLKLSQPKPLIAPEGKTEMACCYQQTRHLEVHNILNQWKENSDTFQLQSFISSMCNK